MRIKALILAAGEGKRLWPFSSKEDPKVLLPFLGKPLLCYHLEEFKQAGIAEFVVVCNPQNKSYIQKMLKRRYPRWQIEFAVQKKLLGPAQAIYAAHREIQRADFFILKYADSLEKNFKISLLLNRLKKNPQDGIISLFRVSDFGRFGIARFQGKKLCAIVEKPKKNPPSDLAWRGLSI